MKNLTIIRASIGQNILVYGNSIHFQDCVDGFMSKNILEPFEHFSFQHHVFPCACITNVQLPYLRTQTGMPCSVYGKIAPI
jgi:hypothetical protein